MEALDVAPIGEHGPNRLASRLNRWISNDLTAQQTPKILAKSDGGLLTEQHSKVDSSNVDSLLAKELNQLSMRERETIYEEIHGVDKGVEETPELDAASLAYLDQELRKIPFKPAYDQAARLSPHYVTDRKFCLKFLRADSFDPKKAAIRLVKFMEEKLKLFGPKTLVREVYLSDMNKDDITCLKSGCLQLLPLRDRAGRAILGNFRNLIPRCYKDVENMVRVHYKGMIE
jgi:hypothetical protein